jgi:hypothetical protein
VFAPIKDADVLSTVALALAVLAFVAQLLVFIAQSWSANQQMVQSEGLNRQTQALLAQVQVSAQSTQALLSEQFDTVLRHALGTALPKGADTDRVARNVRRELDELLARSPMLRAPRVLDEGRISSLKSWPSSDVGAPAAAQVGTLSPRATAYLSKFALDNLEVLTEGGAPGFYVDPDETESAEELVNAGLLQFGEPPPEFEPVRKGRVYARLTDTGEIAGRLFTAEGDRPAYMQVPSSRDETAQVAAADDPRDASDQDLDLSERDEGNV